MNAVDREVQAMLREETSADNQGSGAWMAARLGKATASNFRHVLDFTGKGNPTAKRDAYLWDVIVERLTGKATEHYVNKAMEHGTEYEPLARMKYESVTGRMVDEVGFIAHPAIAMCGGSPDGVIDDDGLIEIKAPTSRTHLETVLDGGATEHLPQIQGLLWITGRQWADFVSFDPRMPPGLDLYVERIERDETFIAMLQGHVMQFLAEVDQQVALLRKIAEAPH